MEIPEALMSRKTWPFRTIGWREETCVAMNCYRHLFTKVLSFMTCSTRGKIDQGCISQTRISVHLNWTCCRTSITGSHIAIGFNYPRYVRIQLYLAYDTMTRLCHQDYSREVGLPSNVSVVWNSCGRKKRRRLKARVKCVTWQDDVQVMSCPICALLLRRSPLQVMHTWIAREDGMSSMRTSTTQVYLSIMCTHSVSFLLRLSWLV